MKNKILIYILPGFSILILIVLFTLRHFNGEKPIDETRTVFIKKTENGYQLFRNGNPFYIRGAAGNSHLKELSLINGNTIRLYDTLNLKGILDEAAIYDLAVIVDIPLPAFNKKYNFYSNAYKNNVLKQKIKVLIEKYKNHPALLMWNLGNELQNPLVFRKNDFIVTFNELIDIIHDEDPNHPISTAIGGVSRKTMLSIYMHSPKLDLISFNTFGGTKLINVNLSKISFLFGAKPFYLSELGSNGSWEAELTSWWAPIEQPSTNKAELYKNRYNFMMDNTDGAYLGSLIFFWGNKHEVTYTWFSLFKDDYKSEIIKEVESIWNKSNTKPTLIGLDYMLVDGKGVYNNIIFAPNEMKLSEIKFIDSKKDSVRIEWEIYPEAWAWYWFERQKNIDTFFNPKKTINNFVSFEKNTATFITPSIEGPYRIFAYIFDQDGYFATTNTPFYVLKNK